MITAQLQKKILILLFITGFCISLLSAIEPHVQWLADLCGLLGDGCRETGQYTIAGMHISIWGMLFYMGLFLAVMFADDLVFWLMMCGVGVELTLIQLMIEQSFFCVFCFLNLIVIGLAFGLTLQKKRLWQAAAVVLMCFVISGAFLLKPDVKKFVRCPDNNDNAVAAVIGNQKIMDAELEAADAGNIYKYKRQIYNLKQKQLDERIEKTLLALEARQKGITSQKLLDTILAKSPQITDMDIQRYYRKYNDYYRRNNKSFAAAKGDIKTYLQDQIHSDTVQQYLAPLKQKYDVVDYLLPPRHPVAKVDISGNPFLGPEDAAVTVVEFSDYMCPACRRAHKLTTKIKDLYQGKIKWVFKDYPLNMHPAAKHMAVAARCAGEQGKFWEYQDLMFNHEGKLDNTILIQYAKKLGLDTEKFATSLRNQKYLAAVEKDIRDAKSEGISSTPTFIINGKLNPGTPSLEKFKEMIDEGLH